MPNAVESLFESVLDALGPDVQGASDAPSEDQKPWDPFDNPFDTDEDRLSSVQQVAISDEVLDQLRGDRTPIRLPIDEEEIIEGGLRKVGFEILAFYKSRRLIMQPPYSGKWGIFYLKQGLGYVQYLIDVSYPTFGTRVQSLEFLRKHERFHYRADLQTLMLEAITKRHLYGPLRRAFRGKRSEFVEEALANRQVWDWSKRTPIGLREFAYDFMKLQPGAYARFDHRRFDLAAEWSANVLDLNISPNAYRSDIAHWVEASPKPLMTHALCPEYIVFPGPQSGWLSPALVLPPVKQIVDGDNIVKRLRKKRFRNLIPLWERTKEKIIQNQYAHGLNLKPWLKDGDGAYSVKVDDANRAHLRHEGQGRWNAYIIGSHKELGHG